MKRFLGGLALLVSGAALSAPFEFEPAIAVSGVPRPGVYHQLDGPGRQHIAVSGETVGVVWEANADGSPQAYFAKRQGKAAAFDAVNRVSTGRTASEPTIASLGRDRFLLAWEQDNAVWARVAGSAGLGPAQKLASDAAHAAIAARDGVFRAAWSERQGKFFRLRSAVLSIDSDSNVSLGTAVNVEPEPIEGDQLYPSLALLARGGVIAWEDRRRGHTAIYYSALEGSSGFRSSKVLNELRTRRQFNYGRGPGAARVALAVCGETCVAATWLDKRDFLSGYDIYAAQSSDGGKSFGKNEKVQDEFGSNISQWHAAIAAGKGGVVVAWDDDRDGSADVWLSWREPSGWSADEAVAGASGPFQQSSPAVAFDEDGNLHLVWLNREEEAGPTQIRYLKGRRAPVVNPR